MFSLSTQTSLFSVRQKTGDVHIEIFNENIYFYTNFVLIYLHLKLDRERFLMKLPN